MTNEQTIDEIMKAPARETWQYGVKTAWYTLDQVTAALAAKDAEIAALKADAERYRWLKSRAQKPEAGPDLVCWGVGTLCGDAADKVIDAAMKAGV